MTKRYMWLTIILYSTLTLGFLSEIFSYLLFEGLFTELCSYCGSACEIWPGIELNVECIEICVFRNPYYTPFFILGTILIAGSIIGLVLSHYRSRK